MKITPILSRFQKIRNWTNQQSKSYGIGQTRNSAPLCITQTVSKSKSCSHSLFLTVGHTCSSISPLIPLFPAISHNLILTSPSNLLNSITIVTSGSRSFTLDRNSAEIESRQVNKYYTWKGFIENKFANKEINSRH